MLLNIIAHAYLDRHSVDLRDAAGLLVLQFGLFHQNWCKLCIKLQKRCAAPQDIFATFSLALMHGSQVRGGPRRAMST